MKINCILTKFITKNSLSQFLPSFRNHPARSRRPQVHNNTVVVEVEQIAADCRNSSEDCTLDFRDIRIVAEESCWDFVEHTQLVDETHADCGVVVAAAGVAADNTDFADDLTYPADYLP